MRGRNAGRKPELTRLGVRIHDATHHADYVRTFGRADMLLEHRVREIARRVGGCSAGVCSILASSALALSASRLLYQRGLDGDAPDLLLKAARLAESARQHELAAWELAVREAERIAENERTSQTGRLYALAAEPDGHTEPNGCEPEFTLTAVHTVNGRSQFSQAGTDSPNSPPGGIGSGGSHSRPKSSPKKVPKNRVNGRWAKDDAAIPTTGEEPKKP